MIEIDKYENVWIAFVNIKAKPGYVFHDLISSEETDSKENYIGAWANILLKADIINDAINIIPRGLDELGFEVIFIDKVENICSLIDDNILNSDVLDEIAWLQESTFVFKVSDAIFPYSE